METSKLHSLKLGHVSRQKSEAGSAEEAPASNPSSR